jgi:2-hydroxy-6-oxonona-2,4-dienedioate hydrolase
MSMWLDLAGLTYRIRFVTAGGIRTRLLEAGRADAQPVVFLHGSGGYLEAYTRNIAAHAEHFRVIALDMLGHGFSDKPDHPYRVRDYVAHLKAVCDALALDRVHLSGESLGGWVAARFALAHPERVRRLVLNTAAGVHFDPAVSQRIRDLSIQAAAAPSRENIRKRLEWLMLDPTQVSDEMVEMRYRVYCEPGFARVMEHIMCLHTAEYRLPELLTTEELARLAAPTLVLWTSHDPGSSVAIGQGLADRIPGARFVVMDRCGHWPQFEDAAAFNRLHIDFLLGR